MSVGTDPDGYSWICVRCFNDFRDSHKWIVAETSV